MSNEESSGQLFPILGHHMAILSILCMKGEGIAIMLNKIEYIDYYRGLNILVGSSSCF